MFYVVIDITVFVLMMSFGLTQIFLPLANGTPLFPFFRRRKLHRELREANEDIEDEELINNIELTRLRAQVLREMREKTQQETDNE